MITLTTRLLLLFQLLVAVGLFTLLDKTLPGVAAAVCSVMIVILVRLLICANNFFIAWRHCSETPIDCRLGWRESLRLFVTEFRASILTSSWNMPFRAFSRRVPPHPVGWPVLLIHGYACNSGYWHVMSQGLVDAGISHRAIDLEPILGDIDEYVPLIHRAVAQLCEESGQEKIVIVAHSMGGLAVRAYLRDHGTARIAKVITLGTPHHGTALAHLGLGVNTRQMCPPGTSRTIPSGQWLETLAAQEDKSVYGRFVSIYSHHDNIIAPQTSCHLSGAKNVAIHGVGHVALGFDSRVQQAVIAEVREAACGTT